ncbi:MAG: hypothetical protein COV67_11395 [Nitrospinae bacterium CG11_big_fil_rev_8_21_14_0_20_56_8]|nr:MAG: hypothetical protein COV67_11395 [Nitrospinae bacterium CG11_big_fil_rev_8_21_14_0_20_56_8]
MTRSDLTTKLSLRMNVSKREAEKYLTAFLDSVMESLEEEGRVVVQGFGSFTMREYQARQAKKPITGETIDLPVRRKPVFHAGKDLREKINREVLRATDIQSAIRKLEHREQYLKRATA